MYTRRGIHYRGRALWLSPWARDNGSHTTYLVSEAMYFSPSYRTDRSNELRLVPRPPTMYTRRVRTYRGAHCGSAHGARDNGSHTTYLVSEANALAPRISRTDRSNELRLVP
jgi:hypothetical protein